MSGCTGSDDTASSGGKPFAGQTLTYWATIQGTGPAQTKKTLTAEFAGMPFQIALKKAA